jgi:nucleotide-binding universal stress UspA family protein
MKRFQKILVPLQLAESDRAVLGMASRIASWARPAEMLFCHFSPKAQIPANLKQTHPWLFESIDRTAMEEMGKVVGAEAVIPDGTRCSFHVEAGNPVAGSLGMILGHDCDLVVVGSDPPQMAVRLARKAPCSVCVMPPDAPTLALKPLVAVDFSEHSRYACEIGFALAKAAASQAPALLHVCPIHPGYKWSTISREELIASNESYARLEMNNFILGLDHPPENFSCHFHHHDSVPFGILDFVKQHDFDCIVAGCRGKDALSALLLGSDIEQVITHSPVPVIAAKIKGTGRSFVEEILGMNH